MKKYKIQVGLLLIITALMSTTMLSSCAKEEIEPQNCNCGVIIERVDTVCRTVDVRNYCSDRVEGFNLTSEEWDDSNVSSVGKEYCMGKGWRW